MTEALLEYDIIIIGSGAGGGTLAKELSGLCGDKGLRIALLEWGGGFNPRTDNTRQEMIMAERYYFDGGAFRTASSDMTLAFAKAVGGSTTVYTGTSLRIPENVLQKWDVPDLTMSDLAPRFEKYINENNVHLNREDELNDNNRLFYDACRKLSWRVAQFPVNTKDCAGLATCNLGCAVGAKQGTAAVQIPLACANGVELISFCRVDRIVRHINGRVDSYEVLAEILPAQFNLKPSRFAAGKYRILAKKIVIAAGAVNSPALIERSFGRKRLPQLGRYFTCHPALILVGEHDHAITNTKGHPKSFYCDEFSDSQRFLLETCMYFPFTLAKNLVGYGQTLDDLVRAFPKLQMILVLAIDDADSHNRVSINRSGEPVVHYRFSEKCINSLLDGIRASTRVFFEAGVTRAHAPCMKRFFIYPDEKHHIDTLINRDEFKLGKITITAAHLMGGCRMGKNPDDSVTDSWGRVHGLPGIYVADASLFPMAAEVNPYLTIMALADRVSDAVKSDW